MKQNVGGWTRQKKNGNVQNHNVKVLADKQSMKSFAEKQSKAFSPEIGTLTKLENFLVNCQ